MFAESTVIFQRPFLSATLSEEEWRVGRQIYKLFLKYTNSMNDRQKIQSKNKLVYFFIYTGYVLQYFFLLQEMIIVRNHVQGIFVKK